MNMLKTILGGLSVFAAATVLTATAARAAPVILPSGLNAGDQYRLAFVTSTPLHAVFENINFYNEFVDDIGDTVLASDWKAIASTAFVHAYQNTGTADLSRGGPDDGVPIYLLDGTRFADDYFHLWSAQLLAPLNITELGTPTTETSVWTGTDLNGAGTFWTLGSNAGVTSGDPNATGGRWMDSDVSSYVMDHSFYAISSVLTAQTSTIPVSAPGPVALFAMGVAGLALVRRRRTATR